MGMYTKFNVILPIAQDTPKDILERIKKIMNGDDAEFDFVLCCSHYFTGTNNTAIKYPFDWRDDYESIVLHIDCDSKDYHDEQQKFLEWICPYIDRNASFLGYQIYEETKNPTLFFYKDGKILNFYNNNIEEPSWY